MLDEYGEFTDDVKGQIDRNKRLLSRVQTLLALGLTFLLSASGMFVLQERFGVPHLYGFLVTVLGVVAVIVLVSPRVWDRITRS